ncbi:hypothetical protein AHMF7605_05685 [Adhaeribacter arboris]|uniref:DUF3500 domain-containing protein n=1 Tax=Adhaeribacter arboris TaxID=2072846 RepID=A0A2T2YC04_9BACT|nr:DUF3500 domain-containing protein [Adhaeribacter arboris]PSR53051.1 hypothetical protein AHMF7605_05685 [Adhaeribacter arboris]
MRKHFVIYALPAVLLLNVITGCKENEDDSTTTPDFSTSITTVLSNTTSANTTCGSATGLAKVVCLAESFKSTLDATQLSAVQLTYSKANAQRWSNLPEGLYRNRVGLDLASLDETQLAAFRDMMVAVLTLNTSNEGYDEMLGNLVADDYLNTAGGGSTYGAGNYYLAFLGIPSVTGLWELQFGGHHYTFANTYNNGTIAGVTPSFRAIEPMDAVSANNKNYQPMEQERQAFAAMLGALSSAEQTTAKLSSSFNDVLLGPGKDAQFPTTKQGLQVGSLSADKKTLVLNAIQLYTNDLDSETATAFLNKYTSELDNTYIAFAGSTAVTSENDYIRIDGPSVWIEFSYQGGIVIRGTPHPHSVWRDRTSDYGGQ